MVGWWRGRVGGVTYRTRCVGGGPMVTCTGGGADGRPKYYLPQSVIRLSLTGRCLMRVTAVSYLFLTFTECVSRRSH